MLTKPIKLIVAALIVASLLLPGAPAALARGTTRPTPTPTLTATPAAPVVSSPEKPLAYADQWVDLQPGEWHWYAFKYTYDVDQAPAAIRFVTNPGAGATLVLLNGEQVKAWEHGEKLQSFGAATVVYDESTFKEDLGDFCDRQPSDPACTDAPDKARSQCENKRDPSNTDDSCNYAVFDSRGYATWSGLIGASGTYYILVRGNPTVAGPIQYRFTTSGEGMTVR